MAATKLYYPYDGNKAYKSGEYMVYAGTVYLCVEDCLAGQNPSTQRTKWIVPFSGFGSVTVVDAEDLSPLFTTVVNTATSTPDIVFSQISQAQNLVYSSPSGSSGNPTFRALTALDMGIFAGSYSTTGAATTVFTVTIGVTMANTTYKVSVTPTAILTAAPFYVTNKTITAFDVTYLAGLTGAVTFDWIVRA